MPKPSSYILFYRRNTVHAYDFYITYNYATFSSDLKIWGLDDYKVKFQKTDAVSGVKTDKTYEVVIAEIAHFKTAIATKYAIPEHSIRLKLNNSGNAVRFVVDTMMAPNFYNLPGGGAETSDTCPLDTAVREAHEELGFDKADITAILSDVTITTVAKKGDRTVYLVNADKITGTSIHAKLVATHPTAHDTCTCSWGLGKTVICVKSESEIITADWYDRSLLATHLGKFSFVLSRF